MKRFPTTQAGAALMLLLLAAAPPLHADEGALQSRMDAYVVEVDDEGNERVRPANEVEPGAMIEWRIVFDNTASSPQQDLVVTGPVPPNTEYVADSARTEVPGRLTVSIDGGQTFEPEPVKRRRATDDGRVREVVVPASEYTHLRWQASEPIRGFASQEYRYRVRVTR